MNNWILLFCAFFVLFATMFPTASMVTGRRLTIARAFFNKWMAPIGLILLFLTGVGPLLAWRRRRSSTCRTSFCSRFRAVSCGRCGWVALGVRIWSSGLCFALSGFVFWTITVKALARRPVRQGATGSDIVTALITSWRGRTKGERRVHRLRRHRADLPRVRG